MEISLPHRFEPRYYQVPTFKALDEGILRLIQVWHRRSGKDKCDVNLVAKKMFERVGGYYYFFPTYAQGKKILWEGMDGNGMKFIDHFPSELVKRRDNGEMLIETINGSIFQVIGTDNFNSIVGTNPVGCVFSEFSLQDPRAWELVRPILKENRGWAIFNFTPRGKNHAYKLLEMAKANPDSWFYQVLTVKNTKREDGTPVISEKDIEDERREGMDEELIQQEYFCSFHAALTGAYYGKIMQTLEDGGRMQKGIYDPNLKVSTWWDLGIDDSMSILFTQGVGKELRFIDYEEGSGEGLAFYAKVIQGKPYVYESHNAPHDIEVRELGTGKSRKEVAKGLGIDFNTIPRPEKKEDGIQAVRSILPRVWIDIEKCERLVDALKSYSKKWDEKNKTFLPYPAHSWASHGADAVQTFALGYKEIVAVENVRINVKITYDRFGRPIVSQTGGGMMSGIKFK